MHPKWEILYIYSMSRAVFSNLKVIELSSVLAGPAVGMFFAELGAKVIKVENLITGGDVTRTWKLPTEDKDKNISAYYHSINWNKQSLFKNLKDPQDKKEVYDLIATADIVISNFRPAPAKKLGFDYESLKAINPTLIFGLITAYGEEDERPGFDALIQAETGWMHMNGSKDGPPIKMPVALMDIIAAHHLKEGILVALIQKLKNKIGAKVSVSLYDAAVASLANQASNWLNLNHNPQRKGSLHPNIAPYGEIITTKEGIPLLLAIGNQKQFENLCKILGCPEVLNDSRFRDNTQRVTNRIALLTLLQASADSMSAKDIIAQANKFSVPLGPINDLKTVFADSKAQALILENLEADGSTSKRVKTAVFKIS